MTGVQTCALPILHDDVKNMYETMTHEGYEDSLKEIEKMHQEMKRLYAEIAKIGK